jgi:two-component system KDP operon response regulator KdpE
MAQKILVVDDDPTLLRFLLDFLNGESFTVVSANNGPEGLRVAYREHPDLVILDVMMPVMDGWEVCARLREMSDVPIILLTAKSAESDKLRGFRLGVDDYVTKPFSFAELSARIHAVLARTQKAPSNERNLVSFGPLVLDLDRRELRRGEEIIALTPTEYRMLEFIGRNQDRAVSEAELMQEVWGNYRQEDTVAVRRYIWLLRQKIEEDPANPRLILTVRGFGYRLGSGAAKQPEG